ncbi:MAG: hypothetical protein ACD_17C00378G0001 [uncultured bacterium]|nr:MAG: hypothetical protein ACD_17C00378G0001 [uncultured bacterium]
MSHYKKVSKFFFHYAPDGERKHPFACDSSFFTQSLSLSTGISRTPFRCKDRFATARRRESAPGIRNGSHGLGASRLLGCKLGCEGKVRGKNPHASGRHRSFSPSKPKPRSPSGRSQGRVQLFCDPCAIGIHRPRHAKSLSSSYCSCESARENPLGKSSFPEYGRFPTGPTPHFGNGPEYPLEGSPICYSRIASCILLLAFCFLGIFCGCYRGLVRLFVDKKNQPSLTGAYQNHAKSL